MRIGFLIVGCVLALSLGCGESPEHKLEQAKLALNAGRPDAALKYAKDVVEAMPNNADALLVLAKAHLRLRQFEESKKLLRLLISLDVKNAEPHRELLNLALASMSDLLSATEFTTNPALDEKFTSAKELGHEQADWFANEAKDMATSEFARARLVFIDSQRIEKQMNEEEKRIRGEIGIEDSTAEATSAAIEEQRRQIKAMQKTAEWHLEGALAADLGHFPAAATLSRMLKKREAWEELWNLAAKMQVQKELPAAFAAELAVDLLGIPEKSYSEAARVDAARELLDAVAESGRSSTAWKIVRARLYLREKDHAKAIALAQEAHRSQPKDADIRLTYAWCLYETEQYAHAKTLLDGLALERRSHEQTQLLYGMTLMKTGERTLAVEALRRVTEINPDNQLARTALVKLLSENRDTVAIVQEDIKKLYQSNPSDPDAIRYMFLAEMAANSTNGVRTLLTAVEKLSPRKPGHLRVLVDGYIHLKDRDKALEYAKESVRVEPDKIESHLVLVRVHLIRNESEIARQTLVALRDKFPDSPSVNETLAQIYLNQGENDRAIELASAIVKEKPDHVNARLMLAHAYGQLSLVDEALEQIKEILDRNPDDPRALEMAASLHRLTGQHDLAKSYLDRIDESSIDETKYPAVLAQLKLQKGDVGSARAICEGAISAGNSDPRIRLTLVSILSLQKNVGEEEIQLEAYVRQYPTNYQGYHSLAKFYAINNAERGIAKFQALRNTNEPLARMGESGLLHSLGRFAEAVKILEELFPRMVARRDPLTWTYARHLAATIVRRDRSTQNAVAVYDTLIEKNINPARAMLTKLDMQWASLDDAARAGRLQEVEKYLGEGDLPSIGTTVTRYVHAKRPELAVALVDQWALKLPANAAFPSLRGDLLLSMGKHAESIEAYQKAVTLEPDASSRYIRLAEAQIVAGLFPAAEATLDRMGAIDTGAKISALWSKASLFIRLGLHAAAEATLEELRSASKVSDPRVLLALGQTMLSLDRAKEARATLLNVPPHAPEFGTAQVLIARIEGRDPALAESAKARLEKLGEYRGAAVPAARELLNLASQTRDADQFLEWADRAIGLPNLPAPMRVQWILIRANIHSRKRDWDAVDKAIADLLAIDPKQPDYQAARISMLLTLGKIDEAKAFFGKSEGILASHNGLLIGASIGLVKAAPAQTHPFFAYLIAMANGDHAAATAAATAFPNITSSLYRQDLLDEVKRAKDQNVDIETYRLLVRAAVAQQIGLPELSEALCQDLLKKQPTCIPAHAIRLASMKQQQMSLTDAMLAASTSVPQSSLGLYVIASKHQEAKEWEPAIAAASKLVAREHDHDRATLHLVQLLVEAKEFDKAITLLRSMYDLGGSRQIVAGNDLAYLLMEHHPEKLAEAHQIALNAEKLMPSSAAIQDTLGWIEHLQGNHAKALAHLAKAYAGNTESHDWHFHIGKVYSQLGNEAWARRHLSVAKDGKGEVAKKATAALANLDKNP